MQLYRENILMLQQRRDKMYESKENRMCKILHKRFPHSTPTKSEGVDGMVITGAKRVPVMSVYH